MGRVQLRQLSLLQKDGVTNAQSFAGFGRSDSRVHGEPVVVGEASFGRPAWNVRAAKIRETLLETGNDLARLRIPRRNGAARAGITALEVHFTDANAYGASLFLTEEPILPERRDVVDLERGAESQSRLVNRHARKQLAYPSLSLSPKDALLSRFDQERDGHKSLPTSLMAGRWSFW